LATGDFGYARETAMDIPAPVGGAIISSEWDVASKTGSYARLAEQAFTPGFPAAGRDR
jgi:hypothetical protein